MSAVSSERLTALQLHLLNKRVEEIDSILDISEGHQDVIDNLYRELECIERTLERSLYATRCSKLSLVYGGK